MENSEAVWSDEQLRGARGLRAPGPFASEEQTAALDEAVAVLERADRLDERATAALATLAGPAYVPIAPPMHVMGGFRADVHNWWFEWPDHYFVPGDSQERWLGVQLPAVAALRRGISGSGFPLLRGGPEDWTRDELGPATAVRHAQRRRVGRGPRVPSADDLALRADPSPGDRVDLPIGLLRQLGLGSQLRHRRAARRFARAHRVGVDPATKAWEQATNGLGGTPVSATREVMTTTDSGPSSGTKSDHV